MAPLTLVPPEEETREMDEEREEENGPDSAEGEKSSDLSEDIPDEVSGEGDTPLGATDEHSEAPGPHGTD